MDQLTFPNQLVDHLISAWANMAVEGAMPPRLPGRAQLRRLLEVAYVASLETEEGRPTTFTLCCVHANYVQPPSSGDVEWWPFAEPRAFEVQELRRLAAATNHDASAIWVRWEEIETSAPRIYGLLNVGAAGAGVVPGFATRAEVVPDSLMLRIEGPGRLTVYYRDRAMLSLVGGRLNREDPTAAPLLAGHPLLLESRQHFEEQLRASGAPIDITDGAYLDSAFRTLLVIMLAGIQRVNSGGTLVLVSPGSAAQAFLKPKYAMQAMPFLATNYTAMLLARANLDALIGPGRRARDVQDNPPDDLQRFYLLRLEARTARQRVQDGAEFLARLSGADGATVLTSTLCPVGFGVEIAYGPVNLPPVYDVKEDRLLDVEEFGMRHRSAIRLVAAAPDVVAFVVSRDGSVNMIFGQDGRVTFHRDVPLVRGVV